jgi:hypothetical protein
MSRSELPHEGAFTWVRGDLKVQIVRPFHPFPRPPASRLPVNRVIGEAMRHRKAIAFADAPAVQRLWVAGAAALVGLKREAFGRSRPDGRAVDRDYSDVVLLLDHRIDEIVASCTFDEVTRKRVHAAAVLLRDDMRAREHAIRELVAAGSYGDERGAEQSVLRIATRAARLLETRALPSP